MTPSQRGASTEAAIAAALAAAGAIVFLPVFGANGPADLIYTTAGSPGSRPVRVQCKTATKIGGALRFWTCSNTNNTPSAYGLEIDKFAVHSPDTGFIYLVDADSVPTRACFLRLTRSRNGQTTGIRWAADYQLVGEDSLR